MVRPGVDLPGGRESALGQDIPDFGRSVELGLVVLMPHPGEHRLRPGQEAPVVWHGSGCMRMRLLRQ